VLEFCGLGYSRPGDKPRPVGGATSDHWIDLEKLILEPNFERLVGDAFSPVGIMLDFWADELPGGTEHPFRIAVINDLEPSWNGTVTLKVMQGERCLSSQSAPCAVPGFGREEVTITAPTPADPGSCTLQAELTGPSGPPVRSLRDVRITAGR
jgi:hypothetical protein